MSQPSLFYNQLFPDTFQAAHLAYEQLHDDNRRYRKEVRVVFYRVDLEEDDPLLLQV